MTDILNKYTVRMRGNISSLTQDEPSQTVQEVLVDTLVQLFTERPPAPSSLFHQLIHNRVSDLNDLKLEEERSTDFHSALVTLLNPPKKPKKLVKQLDDEGNEIDVEEDDVEVEGDDEELNEQDLPKVGDVVGEFKLLENAGIGLSHMETYALVRSMKGIADTRKPISIRFFGKIIGLDKCYYILELVETPKEEEEEDDVEEDDEEGNEEADGRPDELKTGSIFPPEEKHGIGANLNVYLVSNSPAALPEQWTQLPHSTPEMVLAARDIKSYFTGNLDANVRTHPPFPGKERDYLRAQIARIWSSTVIAPVDYMVLENPVEDEDDEMDNTKRTKFIKALDEIPPIIQNEEYDPLKSALNRLSNWVHITPTLLHSQGRCTLYRPEGEEEEEEDDEDESSLAKKKKKPEPEMILPLLTPISLEEPMTPRFEHSRSRSHIKSLQSWIMSSIILEDREFTDQMLAMVRSTRWPGAYCVARIDSQQEMQFVNVYIGFGHKASIDGFSPVQAPRVQEENTMEDEGGNRVRAPNQVEQVDPSTEKLKEFIEPEKPPTPRDDDEDEEKEEDEKDGESGSEEEEEEDED